MTRTYRKEDGHRIEERLCAYPRPRFPNGVDKEWRRTFGHKPMRAAEHFYLRRILKFEDWDELTPLPNRWPLPYYW